MKHILVTGANGQLGREIQLLSSQYSHTFYFTDIDTLDILDTKKVEEFFKKNKIDFVINCAAYTAVDAAETNKDKAYQLNAIAVRNLAEITSKQKAFLVHISTDYVFNGKHYKPYTENDSTQPTSIYGRTKFEGEIEMLFNIKRGIIIRTSWLYSAFGSNFVKTMLRLSAEKESLNVVYDQIGTPTYAGDLAKAILELIPQTERIKQTEIYHFSNEGVCSWYDFAKEIVIMAKQDCIINPIVSKDYPTEAIRPHFSVLDKSKFKKTFGLEIPYWKDSLRKCITQINNIK